jgi:putative ABC transport system permease protein
MTYLTLSWRMLRRDLRAGELRLLGIAMMIAVASLTSVSFFTDRVSQALVREANQLLGGDLLLTADHPWPTAFGEAAARHGLKALSTTTFTSMASFGPETQLVGVKAVQPGYPLRGSLRIAPGLNRPDAPAPGIPERGTAWLDERLSTALGVRAGDTISLGNARFAVAAVLTYESDRGTNFFSIVPRLMIHADDLPATGLIQVGSRVSYRLQIAGATKAVSTFQKWATLRLGRGEQIEDINNARPEVRSALDRAQRFLRLAALLAVVLAAVAVGLATRRYMQRHLDGCAVMRCLGARQGQVLRLYLGEFLVFGTATASFGCALGYASQLLIERMLADLLAAPLPPPSLAPLGHGFAVGLALVLGFIAPQLLRLGRVSTVRVLRREWGGSEPVTLASHGIGAAALALLMLWIAGELRLGLIVLGGFAAALALYAVVGRLVIVATGRVRRMAGAGWRYGLANLRRRLGSGVVQTVALGLGMTALLLLTLSRGELLDNWRRSVPHDAPNRFIINIQPDQRDSMRELFARHGLPAPDLMPMVRGRMVAVNGKPVAPGDYADERAQRLVEREFNLSWAARLPEGNSVTAGRWFGDDGAKPGFSVELGLAQTLSLTAGDTLGFEIAGSRIEAPITSLRRLDWDSMRVNFFVIAPPEILEIYPASYITSFYLPAEKHGLVNELIAAHPNLTVIDVAAMLRQVQSVMGQLARAVQFIFGFALVAGLVVLFAAIEATHDERQFEVAVMRTLGARDRQLRSALAVEFATLGAVAGLLAGLGANAISSALAHWIFKLPFQPGWATLIMGVLGGALVVTVAGLAGTAHTLRAPALQAIRESA